MPTSMTEPSNKDQDLQMGVKRIRHSPPECVGHFHLFKGPSNGLVVWCFSDQPNFNGIVDRSSEIKLAVSMHV